MHLCSLSHAANSKGRECKFIKERRIKGKTRGSNPNPSEYCISPRPPNKPNPVTLPKWLAAWTLFQCQRPLESLIVRLFHDYLLALHLLVSISQSESWLWTLLNLAHKSPENRLTRVPQNNSFAGYYRTSWAGFRFPCLLSPLSLILPYFRDTRACRKSPNTSTCLCQSIILSKSVLFSLLLRDISLLECMIFVELS